MCMACRLLEFDRAGKLGRDAAVALVFFKAGVSLVSQSGVASVSHWIGIIVQDALRQKWGRAEDM